jgi:hypothetical protein
MLNYIYTFILIGFFTDSKHNLNILIKLKRAKTGNYALLNNLKN